jgi:hypothetical protein
VRKFSEEFFDAAWPHRELHRCDANFPNIADAEHEANVGLSEKQ